MSHQEKVPTVKIRHKGGNTDIFTINFADFDQTRHELVTEGETLKPLTAEQKQSLQAETEKQKKADEPIAYTVGSTGRGATKKWFVHDADGNAIGVPYDTEEEALAQIDVLKG